MTSTFSPAFSVESAAAAVLGGAVLGTVAMTKLRTNGTVLGISGIVGGLVKPGARAAPDAPERAAFLVGLLSAGAALASVLPRALGAPDLASAWSPASVLRLCAAGFFVGLGTARGNGCTSGHGIMGNARLALRSFTATCTFMACGAATASLAQTAAWRSFLAAPPAAASVLFAGAFPPAAPASAAAALALAAGFGTVVALSLAALLPKKASSSSATSAGDKAAAVATEKAAGAPARRAVAGASGLFFGLALGLAGMVDPVRVAGFLDLSGGVGRWDPTLGLVMAGALGLAAPTFRAWAPGGIDAPHAPPHAATSYGLPSRQARPDFQLVSGAALFGCGWGLAGVCPGPALVALGGALGTSGGAGSLAASAPLLLFNAAMVAGWASHHRNH